MRFQFPAILIIGAVAALCTESAARANDRSAEDYRPAPPAPAVLRMIPAEPPGLAPPTVLDAWRGVAPCLAPAAAPASVALPSTSDMSPVDAAIAGFRFHSQPKALVEAFRRLTAGLHRPTDAASACDTVQCAAVAVFGADAGPALLLLAAAYHFDAADLVDPARPGGDLDDVAKAFLDLPPSMFPLNRREYRVIARRAATDTVAMAVGNAQGEVVANAGEGAPGILLHNGWNRMSPNARRVAIVHELGHEFIRVYGRGWDWRAAWQKATYADMVAMSDGRSAYVSAYARSNLDEDFAESFAAYRYMPQALKRRAPHRYALLQDWAFKGLEYGAATAC